METIDPADLRIDTFRVAEHDSAVRVTHVPTGAAVIVDDEASVDANRREAIARLTTLIAGR